MVRQQSDVCARCRAGQVRHTTEAGELMRIRRSVGAAVGLALTVTMLAACNSNNKSTASKSGGGSELVGVDYPRADSDFWNSYIKYTPQMAGQLGVKITTTNSANDVTKLVANVQALT